MKSNLFLTLVLSSFNLLLAQTTFEEKIITDNSYVIRPSDAFFGDIDGDGDLDIMTAGNSNVVWYENTDGQGSYGIRKLIKNYPFTHYVAAPFLADIDGDGDLDAIVSNNYANRIVWFKNVDGLGNFGVERNISDFQGSVYFDDIDSDGDLDLLSSYNFNGNRVVWLENLNGLGQFGNQTIVDGDVAEARSLKTADLDGDGDKDILLATYYDNSLIWYENLDGNGTFGPKRIISSGVSEPTSVFAADIDNDGDLDIISSSNINDFVAWQENIDGAGNFGPLQYIGSNIDGAIGINVEDIDSDGDNDVFFAAKNDNYFGFFENLNAQGSFSSARIVSDKVSLPTGIKIADVDNDGNLDVMCIAAKSAKISWYKNEDGMGNFGNQNIIVEDVDYIEKITSADLDGDGDLDLISASNNDYASGNSLIAWFENMDGHGNFGKPKGIDYPNHAVYIRAADVDGDNDIDLIAGTHSPNIKKIVWYENLDGLGNFGPVNDISNSVVNILTALEVADIDGDNDIDILFRSSSSFGWMENTDGLGNFNVQHDLPSFAGTYSDTFPADLDNDGDIDILSLRFSGTGQATWLKNLDGMGNFSDEILIYQLAGGSVRLLNAVDMDMDGDMDVVIGATDSDENLIWVENTDGNGSFGNVTVITQEGLPNEVAFGDLDNDNDMDVAFTHYYQNKIGWIENIDGQGNFGAEIILTDNVYEANDVIITDLDGDLDMDIVASSYIDCQIIWYKNTFILSLLQNSTFSFSIYPNPTTQIVNIESATKIVGAKIYNHLGQLLLSVSDPNGINFLNIENLSTGIYFLKVTDTTQKSSTKKFIKQN